MANNREYIERLKLAIEHLHKCRATHSDTVPVHETFEGRVVWSGNLAMFELTNALAFDCYAWSYQDDEGEKIATVLCPPPVKAALDAVRVHIVAEGKKRQGK